jgi:uncharacterized protein (UPF0276 family)
VRRLRVVKAALQGLGLGWRPELALMIERHAPVQFVEVLAESCLAPARVPLAVHVLRERGVQVVPHGVSLSLGSAQAPERARLHALAQLARELKAPVVSEHLAFVRAGRLESGHLLPLPRTREALDVVVRNVRAAQALLPVPLALENIAALFEWPGAELTPARFLAEVLERADVQLLLDVENLYADARNHGVDAIAFLDQLPLERIAYVHVAGGFTDRDGLYHDTHAHAVPRPVFDLLHALAERRPGLAVMIERDDDFPDNEALLGELQAVRSAMECGR